MKHLKYNAATLYILLISILYYILCYLFPITLCDDIIYKFIWPSDNNSFVTPISDIKDIAISQYIHYHILNGRSIVHFLLQLFDGVIGKGMFNIISSIFFCCLIYMVSNFITKKRNSVLSYTLITLMLFVVMPGFYNEFLLFVGVFNYLWVATATIALMLYIMRHKQSTLNMKTLVVSSLAFWVGWLHEGISVPLSMTLVTYCIINHKNIWKHSIFYFTLFYILGTLICICSPGTIHRIGLSDGLLQMIYQKLFLGCVNLTQLRITYIMLILSVITYNQKKNIWKEHFSIYKYFYLTWIFTFIPVFGSGVTESRTVFFTELVAMIISIDLLLHLYEMASKKSLLLSIYGINGIILLLYSAVLYYSLLNYQNYRYIIQQLQNPKLSIVEIPQITPVRPLSFILDEYIREPIKFGPFENAQAFVENNTHVKCIKILYGKKELHFVPKDIMNKIKSNSLKYNRYTYNNNKEMLAIKIATNCSPTSIKFLLYKEDINSLPFYKRLLAYHGNTYEQSNYYYDTINYGKSKYLLICCPTRNISRRIKYVVYKH